MNKHITALLAAAIALTVAAHAPAADFEQCLAVKATRGPHGHRGMPGDIVQLNDNTLLMSYTKDGGIMATKSADKGKTWSDSFTLLAKPQPPAKGYYCHPGFLRLKNGDILFSYIHSTYPTTPYFGKNYVRRSADETKTWTDQFIMTPYPGYVLVHNDRLFTLSTGRIIAMAEYKAHYPSSHDHNGYAGMSFYSDDLGHSWYPSKNYVDMMPVEVQEADAVELKDGRLLMFARTYSGYPVRAYSTDKGESWSKGQPINELKMPYAGLPTVRRIPTTGDLLFIWITEKSVDKKNPKISRRCALSSAVSTDEGNTFIHQRNIARDPEDDFGYQCVEFLDDNIALIGYHCRDGLRVARIPFDWFYEKN